jgi:hypothetical protein
MRLKLIRLFTGRMANTEDAFAGWTWYDAGSAAFEGNEA